MLETQPWNASLAEASAAGRRDEWLLLELGRFRGKAIFSWGDDEGERKSGLLEPRLIKITSVSWDKVNHPPCSSAENTSTWNLSFCGLSATTLSIVCCIDSFTSSQQKLADSETCLRTAGLDPKAALHESQLKIILLYLIKKSLSWSSDTSWFSPFPVRPFNIIHFGKTLKWLNTGIHEYFSPLKSVFTPLLTKIY